ncbi:MAG: CBS domain-containing protein [Thermoguttaceae bacterium]|nr:CBS domain-containing protein [Thermoguttaceae bacterium]MDW8039531.1 CBS domain-containing protein [Thermoguttaceae bacterium]
MLLQTILQRKGGMVYTIRPDATLQDVLYRLIHHGIGALVVTSTGEQDGQVLGIITERDILRTCASGVGALSALRVSDHMTRQLFTGSPEDPIEEAMRLMTEKRIRHLPILSEGRLVGLVSIGDVVKAQHDLLAVENRFMKDYIRG